MMRSQDIDYQLEKFEHGRRGLESFDARGFKNLLLRVAAHNAEILKI